MVEYVTAIYCPECGGEAEQGAPHDWIVPGKAPEYRHADDKTGLCPVMTNAVSPAVTTVASPASRIASFRSIPSVVTCSHDALRRQGPI
jgi:hypothetical protein